MSRTPPANLLNVFTAAQISTSIRGAECVEFRGRPSDAHQRLSSLRFDQAPVVDRNHVVGWVSTANLATAERVKAVMKPLELSAIVSNEASIADVLRLLAREGLVFTVNERGIRGFITPSDMERHAARSHFHLLVAGIEMLVAEVVREAVAPTVIVDRLDGASRQRWEADFADDSETDPAEYVYLRDLADLFLEAPLCDHRPDFDKIRAVSEGRNAVTCMFVSTKRVSDHECSDNTMLDSAVVIAENVGDVRQDVHDPQGQQGL